jgi:hypothetical protein
MTLVYVYQGSLLKQLAIANKSIGGGVVVILKQLAHWRFCRGGRRQEAR